MSKSDRKPRSDSKLKLLPEDQHKRIWSWLNKPKAKYATVVGLCWEDLGVRTSETALGDFYSWYGMKLRMDKREERVEQIVDEFRRTDPSVTADQLRAFGASLFMSEALSAGDGEAFASAAYVHLKGTELHAKIEGSRVKFEQREREIALEREKFQLTKSRLKEQVADLQKNLGSPDAPARIAALVEAIDSL